MLSTSGTRWLTFPKRVTSHLDYGLVMWREVDSRPGLPPRSMHVSHAQVKCLNTLSVASIFFDLTKLCGTL